MFSLGNFSKAEAKNLNVINLAFIGDAVYSLFVRENILRKGELKANDLNRLSQKIVCAEAQSDLVKRLLPIMTEEEKDVFMRARNAKKGTRPKHALVSEYNNATGFEAVLGYLYLIGDSDRLDLLLNAEEDNENRG